MDYTRVNQRASELNKDSFGPEDEDNNYYNGWYDLQPSA